MSGRMIERYSQYVSLMKWFLLIGIFSVLVFSFGAPYIFFSQETKLPCSKEDIVENRMIHPHYMARDNEGRPYEVRADLAVRKADNQPTNLTNPEGSLLLSDGQTLNVKAQDGLYNPQQSSLALGGNVTLTSTDGYDVATEQATLLINSKVVEGASFVQGKGPKGSLKADKGFKLERTLQGDILSVYGRSQVVINMQRDGS